MTVVETAHLELLDSICRLDEEGHEGGDPRRRELLRRAIEARECLVARRGDSVIGYTMVDRSFFDQPFIRLLVVHPEHRRQGIGSELIRQIEAACDQPKLFTSTSQSNIAMQRLCSSVGFVRTGYVENLDVGDPEIIYVKQLRVRRGEGASEEDGASSVAAIVQDGDLVIRPLRNGRDEFERLSRWKNEPHVREWWDPDDPPTTAEAVEDEYGPETLAGSPTTACIIEVAGGPVGFIQFYRWASFPDETEEIGIPSGDGVWGLDILVGEPDKVNKGLGSRAVDAICRYLFHDRGARAVALTTSVENHRAIRAYEKAGFTRQRQVLDLDRKDGERIRSWLMIRSREVGPPASWLSTAKPPTTY